ncbi:SDR family NAD(P)-dependent oxidoreductase [Saccharothrix syringae]|uniref:SDR family NAD(P)-dependent oxidoreductase n=1 Tax=Saccharothrix syringae TaxID=103733 RepID=A0A5Q0H196_SACSY|nr:SDR family NAD(P)-dependent oxidoreductase [Saccharothrix syringae]QFZ19540.1 SDR family NAD(P)-dependent oxidoreductase [Saccharothrix syringae]
MTRTAVVTGANQGLGFAFVEQLAARLDPDDLVLLTGRDAGRVREAVARVDGKARVEGRVLDVSAPGAIAALARELGEVDVVVSNAAVPLRREESQAAQVDGFVAVGNGATHAVLREFGPRLRPGGRLLVVASGLGTLGHLDPRLHPLFDGVDLDGVERAVERWRAAVQAGTAAAAGWPRWINVPSKVAQVAAVRAVARERREADLAQDTLVAAVCPGLIDTRASRPWFDDFSRSRTPGQAAEVLLDRLLGPVDPATYGKLVQLGHVLPWRSGTPFRDLGGIVP